MSPIQNITGDFASRKKQQSSSPQQSLRHLRKDGFLGRLLVLSLLSFGGFILPNNTVWAYVEDFKPKQPVAVENLKIRNTLPDGAGTELYSYKLSGQVQLGTNSCFAGDNHPVVKQRFENGNLYLWVAVEGSPRNPNVTCLQVYDPVFGSFALEISGERSQFDQIYLVGTSGDGKELVLEDVAILQPEELVMTNLSLTPANDDISPATIINVKVDVIAGDNQCLAGMYELSLKTQVVGKELHVFAVRTRRPETLGTICPAVYQPVTRIISELVTANHNEVDAIVLKHVGAQDNDLRRGLTDR